MNENYRNWLTEFKNRFPSQNRHDKGRINMSGCTEEWFSNLVKHINLDNSPSINLAKSVGMEFECVRKGFIFEFGEWTDHFFYYINFN
ncbi:hypothetical protein V7014_09450 [Bacillus sp. JJ722]